jgi:hypothetical protein
LLADSQPKPSPAVLPRHRAIRLDERLEKLALLIWRDADARVRHAEAHKHIRFGFLFLLCADTTSPVSVNFTALPRDWSGPGGPAGSPRNAVGTSQ